MSASHARGHFWRRLSLWVTQAPAGLTVGELEERLYTPVANLLCRLVQLGRLQRQILRGRQVVYLGPDAECGVSSGSSGNKTSAPEPQGPQEVYPPGTRPRWLSTCCDR